MEESIVHFSHEHPLFLCNKKKIHNSKCAASDLPLRGPAYACSSCNFCLHKSCSELPLEIQQSPLHPSHPLTLLPKSPDMLGVFICTSCQQSCRGFTYRCSECKFDFDIECVTEDDHPVIRYGTEENIKHRSHRHHFTPTNIRKFEAIRCSGCELDIDGEAYVCTGCKLTKKQGAFAPRDLENSREILSAGLNARPPPAESIILVILVFSLFDTQINIFQVLGSSNGGISQSQLDKESDPPEPKGTMHLVRFPVLVRFDDDIEEVNDDLQKLKARVEELKEAKSEEEILKASKEVENLTPKLEKLEADRSRFEFDHPLLDIP